MGTSVNMQPSQEAPQQAVAKVAELVEYEYPVPVIVRNTFIETKTGRSVSLEEFFTERRIRSCPVVPPGSEACDGGMTIQRQPLRRAITTGAQLMAKVAAAAGLWADPEHESPSESPVASQQMPRVLVLSEALPESRPGYHEMPTVGSAG